MSLNNVSISFKWELTRGTFSVFPSVFACISNGGSGKKKAGTKNPYMYAHEYNPNNC